MNKNTKNNVMKTWFCAHGKFDVIKRRLNLRIAISAGKVQKLSSLYKELASSGGKNDEKEMLKECKSRLLPRKRKNLNKFLSRFESQTKS